MKNVLNIITRVILILVIVVVGLISLATAYIVFAPDEYPKPFHLIYVYPTPTPTPDAIEPSPTPIPSPTPRVFKPGEGVMIDMTTKIINLADTTSRKYIRVTIVLEFAPVALTPQATEKSPSSEATATDATTALQDYVTARMPILDDTVITLLSTKTYEDLYTADGKEVLRQQLMGALASHVPDYQLINVYFTEFVVQ